MHLQIVCYPTDAGPLYSKVYENVIDSDEHSAARSAFWRYRTRVSLKHLLYSLDREDHKVLHKFLHQVGIVLCLENQRGSTYTAHLGKYTVIQRIHLRNFT